MKKRLAVLVLAFAMVLTMSVGVFAGTNPVNNAAGAYLTKTLKVPQGVDVPSATFTFNFAPVALDEEGAVADTTTYPAMSPVTVTYAASDRTATGTDEEITKAVQLTFPTNFPKSGVYGYTVSEAKTGFTPAADNSDNMAYAENTYTIKFYVKNGTAGTKEIADVEITDGTNKIDATSDGGDESTNGTDGSNDKVGNDFKFVNTYTKEITENPGDPTGGDTDGAFVLTKALAGDYAGVDDVFKFDVTVDYPATYTGSAKSSTGAFVGTFSDGSTVVVSLKGGQKMSFASLPAGTIITVNEQKFENYQPAYVAKSGSKEDGSAAAEASQTGTKDTALSAGDLVVGKFGARADYTNTFDAVTPTGIIINNLPYVLLIGIALGGIVLFSRKRRYE